MLTPVVLRRQHEVMTSRGASDLSNGGGTTRTGLFRWRRRGRLAETLREQHQALAYLGFRIFKWLLGLVFLLLVGLAVAGWMTYPDKGQFVPDPGRATAEQWSALAAAKSAWVTQLKDLSQAFLFAPVFPLLGAVIGYIFGREGVQSGATQDVAKRGAQLDPTGAGTPPVAAVKPGDADSDPVPASGSTPDILAASAQPPRAATSETSEAPEEVRVQGSPATARLDGAGPAGR